MFQNVYDALPRINEINERHYELEIKERLLAGREKMKKHEVAFIIKHRALCKEGELFGDVIKRKNGFEEDVESVKEAEYEGNEE